MKWEWMKHKQIYFVEIDDKTIKFNGFPALDDFIKELPKGKKFLIYFVQAWTTNQKK